MDEGAGTQTEFALDTTQTTAEGREAISTACIVHRKILCLADNMQHATSVQKRFKLFLNAP
jgi:hypothetical protein